ncbi:MAG: PASTA domain-containing protein [Bacilli bacterium]
MKIKNNKNEHVKGDNMKRLIVVLEILILLIGIFYFIYSLFIIKNDKMFHIINSFLLTGTIILYLMDNINKKNNIYKILLSLSIGLILTVNILNNFEFFTYKEISLKNFNNSSINEILNWAKENNIIIEQTYEYSDNIKEFNIISQDILPNTSLKNISKIKVVVSLGPNYDKLVIIPNMTGLTINDVINKKNELLLNNIIIKYEINEDIKKDIIISQSKKGQFTRNTEIVFIVSLGSVNELKPVLMIDLKNKSLFEATLWLQQNAIKYKLNYEFNTIKKDYIVSHDIKEGTSINPNSDTVNLIVSKGESIKVPNLLAMSSDEVVKWISENKLKIEFSDIYDVTVPLGSIISANYKENDEIETGSLIKIVTSKGQLKMPEFSSLNEFRNWANKYNINFKEDYQMNNEVLKGEIINFSIKTNDTINPSSTIIIYISNGKPVTVPNFMGKSKNEITNICNNIGLTCAFYIGNYSSTPLNNAISQNFKAGSVVTSGAYITIGLSKGIAKNFTVLMNQSSIQSCIGSTSCIKNYLTKLFNNNYPGVTINFLEKNSSTYNIDGVIHESSPIKDGSIVTQGNTYYIWITKT